jgi:hypothetical protein
MDKPFCGIQLLLWPEEKSEAACPAPLFAPNQKARPRDVNIDPGSTAFPCGSNIHITGIFIYITGMFIHITGNRIHIPPES